MHESKVRNVFKEFAMRYSKEIGGGDLKCWGQCQLRCGCEMIWKRCENIAYVCMVLAVLHTTHKHIHRTNVVVLQK